MSFLDRLLGRSKTSSPGPPATLERVETFNKCVQSFLGGDWGACIREASTLAKEHASLQIIQILLISLQRIPHDPNDSDYQGLWQQVVRIALTTKGFDLTLIHLTLGDITLEKTLQSATNANERCKAYYYAGAQKVTKKMMSEATEMLSKAAYLNVQIWERLFAQAELARTIESH